MLQSFLNEIRSSLQSSRTESWKDARTHYDQARMIFPDVSGKHRDLDVLLGLTDLASRGKDPRWDYVQESLKLLEDVESSLSPSPPSSDSESSESSSEVVSSSL